MDNSPLWMVGVIDDLIKVACSYDAFEVANSLTHARKSLISLKSGEGAQIDILPDPITLKLALETCWNLGEGNIRLQQGIEEAIRCLPSPENFEDAEALSYDGNDDQRGKIVLC